MAAFQNFEEVWAALGRLYSDIVKLQETQQQVTLQLGQLGEKVDQLIQSQSQLVESQNRMVSSVSTLAGTVTKLAGIVESHENRMERLEGQ